MPEKATIKKARKDLRQGKSASTAAGEFVREEIHHVRRGKHGARSPEQTIAIGLAKARRAGVKMPAKKGVSRRTKAEPRRAASHAALSAHARKAAKRRTHAQRSASARKAAATRKRNAA